MDRKVLIVGALDTKGQEFNFVKQEFKKRNIGTIVMDAGILGKPFFKADISNEKLAKAGGSNLKILKSLDRGKAIDVMMKGISLITKLLYSNSKIAGIIGMGGSAGVLFACSAMKVVPIGFPKILITTAVSGDIINYVGGKDINIIYSITDISGLNKISCKIFSNAVSAIVGMITNEKILENNKIKPMIALTMMGVTTKCVTKVREEFEKSGYEVLVFAAIGSGGKVMENFIAEGLIDGVLDITTVELTNNLIGGVCDAGPNRLEAAGQKGIPQVISCGGIDFVNYIGNAIPSKFKKRKFCKHNSLITLMRTNKEENIAIAKIMANKLNRSKGPTAVFIPLLGFSSLDAKGKPFYHPEIDKAFIDTLEKCLISKVNLIKCNNHINDPEFSIRMVGYFKKMVKLIKRGENNE